MGTIRESIESAFVAVAFAERNRPDEAVWQLRGEKATPSLPGRAEASAAATSATQTRTATAGQRQRPVLRAE